MRKISIIIRTKNEEKWLPHCLGMVFKQDYNNFEVILVDNQSKDNTLEIAKRFPLEAIIEIEKFIPGKALNDGIRASSGDFIVCLSAHCVPKNDKWLSSLIKNFDNDKSLAGVYGKQSSVSFTEASDKRDLMITFGLDRRKQIKDYFFHNANSMIPRAVWNRYPFDEKVTNIEDRVWGKEVINAGYHIIYDPEAEVYHHHGLHQNNDSKRARGVVSILEQVDGSTMKNLPDSLKPENTNIAAVLPILDPIDENSLRFNLLRRVVLKLKETEYVNRIYVLCESELIAKSLDVEYLDRNYIQHNKKLDIDQLINRALKEIEDRHDYPNSILYVNYEYLHHSQELFSEIIFDAAYKGCDSVFPGLIDYSSYWFRDDNSNYIQTDISMKPRSMSEPKYRALYGLGCLTSSALIRSNNLIGGRVGIVPVNNIKYGLRLKGEGAEEIINVIINYDS